MAIVKSINWKKICPEAYKRGEKDGLQHYKLVMAGERGFYPNDSYPSNPYNKTGDSNQWCAYNAGWNDAY